MDYALVAVGGVVLVVVAAAFGQRLGVAAPLLLVVVGVGYSFIPGVPQIAVPPAVILTGVLPPILYAAAINLPVVDFRRNFGAISALSVLLVLVSALGTGFVLFALLPNLDLGAAIALGAVISPTDVVAASAIGKRLGLPPRLLSILEGEGLVNDATALTLLKTALAATGITGSATFGVGAAVGDFVYAVVVAVIIGLVVAAIAMFVRRRLDQPVLDTAISFVVPFLAYLPAEHLGASGVVAVVAAGISSGHAAARLSTQSRFSERINWRTAQFMLENGVFLLMGAQLFVILGAAHSQQLAVGPAVAIGLLAAAILIVVRFVFVWPMVWFIRRGEQRQAAGAPRLEAMLERLEQFSVNVAGNSRFGEDQRRRFERRRARMERQVVRRQNDIAQLTREGLGFRGAIVLGWSGMRGVVTLAAAQSLPPTTPYYEQLVLIAFVVAIATLLLQGATLPLVIRLSGIPGTDAAADRRQLANLMAELADAGRGELDDPEIDGRPVDEAVIERLRQETERVSAVSRAIAERAEQTPSVDAPPSFPEQYRTIRVRVLDAERGALLEARSRGAYPSRILRRAESMLDLEETRLSPGTAE